MQVSTPTITIHIAFVNKSDRSLINEYVVETQSIPRVGEFIQLDHDSPEMKIIAVVHKKGVLPDRPDNQTMIPTVIAIDPRAAVN